MHLILVTLCSDDVDRSFQREGASGTHIYLNTHAYKRIRDVLVHCCWWVIKNCAYIHACRYWIIFFAYFGMLYVFEYSVASYSVYQAMGNAYPARG